MNRPSARFVLAALLIASTAAFLQARERNEIFPPRLPLQSFPMQLGDWTGTNVPLEKDALDVLGAGDFLNRNYENDAEQQPPVNLFIAYFRSQRTGDTIHSPQHCLPGSGWNPISNTQVTLSTPGHKPFPVNRYVVAKGESRQLVVYWYWAHDRGVANEYLAKYYLVADSIKMNRSDGSLVRIVTQMYPGETADAAQQRMSTMTSSVLPLLDDYIPR